MPYVLPEDFDQEVFTQIYIRAHGVDQVTSYTKTRSQPLYSEASGQGGGNSGGTLSDQI